MNLFRKKSVTDILNQLKRDESENKGLSKNLTLKDLIFFGMAAIVGAGVFGTIGQASVDGGPAVVFLFVFTAFACGFSAFAYAEFASMIPASGSAYTYSYVAFGEIIAWVIGWALIMEYSIGNITMAISWSDYFTGLLESGGLHLPQWIQVDYLTAEKAFNEATALIAHGKSFENLPVVLQNGFIAWNQAPRLFGFPIIADLPALGIIIFLTWLVYRGMKESKNASNVMVVIKIAVILLVLGVGIFYVDTDNWDPFTPNGISGVLKGVSAVFFGYIGFDAISTTAEECKNPQRDLPRGMMWSIVLCTVLYVAIALVLTGMVPYYELGVGDPLAYVFVKYDLKWLSGIIAVSAVIAIASVLLVFQMGQPRIWLSMSRDGLLPKKFSKIHPKFKTPSFATIITGFVVAVPTLFMNFTMVTDLASIGTLFAFSVVCAGVLILQSKNVPRGSFRTPYINSKYILPILLVVGLVYLFTENRENTLKFIKNSPKAVDAVTFVTNLSKENAKEVLDFIQLKQWDINLKDTPDLEHVLSRMEQQMPQNYIEILNQSSVAYDLKFESGFKLFMHKIPLWIFFITLVGLTFWAYRKNLSLIPMLGLICCFYLMAELSVWNWIYFSIWLIIGLVIYFGFSIKNSKLNKPTV